jgi:aldehyde dehydrogenase (NAD+)
MQYKGVRVSMTTDSVQYKSFGMTPDVSACCPPSVSQTNKGPVPVVDRTYKLYYGGAHKRPDGNMSHAVLDGTGKVHAIIADGSR